jgi:hypothetical protein
MLNPKDFFARLKDLYEYMKLTNGDDCLVRMLVSCDYFHNLELQRFGLTPRDRDENIKEITNDNPWLTVIPKRSEEEYMWLEPVGNAKCLRAYQDLQKEEESLFPEISEIFKHCEIGDGSISRDSQRYGIIYDEIAHTLNGISTTADGKLLRLDTMQELNDPHAFGNILKEPITDILERNEYR